MSAPKMLTYNGRAKRYLAQRGIEWDPHRMSVDRLTPAQRRRAMHKERRSWRQFAYSRAAWGPDWVEAL